MRLIFTSIVFIFISVGISNAQSVRIRLDSNTGMFSQTGEDLPNTPFPNTHPDIGGFAWTNANSLVVGRAFFKFDLSMIPANSIITSAKLSLYGNFNNYNPQHSTIGGSNEAYLRQIMQTWSSTTCTWNNQPSVSTVNEVLLGASTFSTQDYLNIDVKDLITLMVQPSSNFGFALMLADENYYRAMNFSSGNCPDTSRRPLLEIDYISPCYFSSINDSLSNADAVISTSFPSSNFSGSTDFVAYSEIVGGTQTSGRSMLNFNLSSIPANANVLSAYIQLTKNIQSFFPSTNNSSGSNDAFLYLISQPWNYQNVSYNTQPLASTLYSTLIDGNDVITNDVLNLDITSSVTWAIQNPSNFNGYLLQLVNETGNRSVNFYSGNISDTTLRPKIYICWESATGIQENVINTELILFPNPTSSSIFLQAEKVIKEITLFNTLGEILENRIINNGTNYKLDISSYKLGVYYLRVKFENGIETKKIIIKN